MIITFEGIEGSGKSTQINKFEAALKKNKIDFISLREPGGTVLSEELRHILLNRDINISPMSELFLFEASRSELVDKIILPALKKNKIILIDRFIDSTVVYQGYGRGISVRIINYLNKLAVKSITIDRTYLLDAPVELLEERNSKKIKDRIEREDAMFHKRIREGFLKIAHKNKDRILKINALLDEEEIHRIILNDFLKLYGQKYTSR